MKLQDILGTDQRYDVQAIAADAELSRQIQTILVNLGVLNPPVDGIFGPLSTAALHRFQTLMNSGEPGYLGAKTAKLLLETKPDDLPSPALVVKIIKETILKLRPVQSSELNESEKQGIKDNQSFSLVAFEPIRNHVRIAFREDSFKDQFIWYVFGKHAEVYEESKLVFPKILPKEVRLENFPYKPQIDNFFNPTGACNVTSMAMCLEYYNVPRRKGYGQFEDELYEYAIQKGYSRWSPYDLAQIVRDYGCRDYFTEKGNMDDLKDWLAEGKPCVIHGYFTSFGHIMPVVGYNEYGLIVHDPYGEWFSTGYRTQLSGAYLNYSYGLIRRTCMPDGDFWVHFISK
ncbi:MAG: C39 family peptidase [Cyanobacteria bacterium J06592_8]